MLREVCGDCGQMPEPGDLLRWCDETTGHSPGLYHVHACTTWKMETCPSLDEANRVVGSARPSYQSPFKVGDRVVCCPKSTAGLFISHLYEAGHGGCQAPMATVRRRPEGEGRAVALSELRHEEKR